MPAALRSPQLRRIILAYSVNRIGFWFGTVALSLAVFDHTHSGAAVAATLLAAQVVPALAVPFLVARVEASRRQRELSGLYWFEAAATAALAILVAHFWLPAILLLVALDGTAALAASALLRAETAKAGREELGDGAVDEPPGHTPRPDPEPGRQAEDEREEQAEAAERQANAALNVAFSVAFVVGPALAGITTAAAGATIALLLAAAAFLLCGTLLVDLHPHVEEAEGESVRARLRAAWAYVRRAPDLRSLLIAQAVAFVFFESAAPIEVVYAKQSLHSGDGGYGALIAAWGAGVVVGSIIFARSPKRSLRLMVSAGTLAVGMAYVAFGAINVLAGACAAAVIGGIGNGVQWTPLVTAVQRLTPFPLRGRVMGALESIGALAPALGLVLGGALLALTSPRTAFYVVGAGALAVTALFVRIPMDRPQAGANEEPLGAHVESAHAVDARADAADRSAAL
ncbi:MAG TPA: MFS transporter [Solirubrobacteraceae bacterium]|nr:MFS transporter [Solirubrobacteraceae bacterium]